MAYPGDVATDLKSSTRSPGGVRLALVWLAGLALFVWIGHFGIHSSTEVTVYGVAAALCFVPTVQRAAGGLGRLMDRRGRVATPLLLAAISVFSGLLLYAVAVSSKRSFFPVLHDEFSYLIQAQMFARGKLAMPAHPLGDFLDTFYLVTDRAYASQYFPGAAMMFVLGVWLHLPFWVVPLVVSSLCAGMIFLIVRELFDGAAGLVGVLLLCSVQIFRFLSISVFSQVPALLLGLMAIHATLRWHRSRKLPWIAAAACALGWMAITRPLDAVVFALPIGAFFSIEIYRLRASAKRWLGIAALAVACVLPFLALQLALNRQVTGSYLQTPFTYYAQRDLPGISLGFGQWNEAMTPVSRQPQKQAFYHDQFAPDLREHTPGNVLKSWFGERGRETAATVVGDTLLLLPVPAALFFMRGKRRWMVASILPLWCAAYSLHPFAFPHYLTLALPSAIVLVIAGIESIALRFPSAAMSTAKVLLPGVIAIMSLPGLDPVVGDQMARNEIEGPIRQFEKRIQGRAIILFVSGRDHPEWENVYNVDVAWPDEARVLRAQDLGDRNAELYGYYATIQPDRVVYRFDRATGDMTRLGTVSDLAHAAN